jgi:hypothetical protein
MYEAAVWESIKDCDLIAPDRFAKMNKANT